jgi:arylsulfatase A-like enzyme
MNVVLIISDTFRYDNLFDRAAMPVRTPELDRFSERAVSASNFYVSSFPTIPHRTDVTTGRYGWPWYPWQKRERSSKNHMPQILGSISQLICDCPHLFNADFNYGFTGAVQMRGQEGDTFFTRMNHPFEESMPLEKTRRPPGRLGGRSLPDIHRWTNRLWYREVDCFAPRTSGQAMEWLEENYRHDPFFLWVDFFDPHEPWDPPEYMVKRYDPDWDGPTMIHPNYGKASDLTAEELKNLRAHYCAEAELVDRWAGRIIQKIDDLRLWDDTIVMFTTDHGMSLGEHNRTGKSCINDGDDRCWPIYPEIGHIPFMIAAPGLEGGRTIDAILQPPDILPTVLDLAGLDAEPPEPFHGRSFAPLLRGESQEPLRDFAISSSHMKFEPGTVPRKSVTPAVYTEKWCYIPIGPEGERELYDVTNDPCGEADVSSGNEAVMDELHAKMLRWLDEMDAPPEMRERLE